MKVEDIAVAELIYRCSACGYQTWAAVGPSVCPTCGGVEFTGLTPIEWRRRLYEKPLLVVESQGGR